MPVPDLPGPATDLSTIHVFHRGFRRDLADFRGAAIATPVDDLAAWRALLRRWDLFCAILADHQANEDLWVWPLLRERCAAAGDPSVSTLDEAEAEHDAIDVLLPPVRDALAGYARGASSDGPSLRAALDETSALICAHLDHEETGALPLVERYLDAQEWDRLRALFRDGVRPSLLVRMAPWVVKGLSPADAAQLRESDGSGLRLALRLGSRAFRRLDRAAFRHVS